MAGTSPHEVTRILQAWNSGEAGALDLLFPLVYDELRGLAAGHLRRERAGHTLQPTALVHEAYLRLLPRDTASVEDRSQFMAVAAQAIRRVLVDHGRSKGRVKRGGDRLRVTLTGEVAQQPELDLDILDLDRAMERLGVENELDQKIVELKFFGGLTDLEAAGVLDCSERTLRRRWAFARAWLYRELSADGRQA